MENANESVHPGLEVLRRLVPDTTTRRDFVRTAVESGMCACQILSHYLPEQVFATPEEYAQIDAFIEWI